MKKLVHSLVVGLAFTVLQVTLVDAHCDNIPSYNPIGPHVHKGPVGLGFGPKGPHEEHDMEGWRKNMWKCDEGGSYGDLNQSGIGTRERETRKGRVREKKARTRPEELPGVKGDGTCCDRNGNVRLAPCPPGWQGVGQMPVRGANRHDALGRSRSRYGHCKRYTDDGVEKKAICSLVGNIITLCDEIGAHGLRGWVGETMYRLP